MKAGIALDDWKLPVYRRRLTAAGYTYEDAGELIIGITVLTVEYADEKHLKNVLEVAERECQRSRQ